MMLPRSLVEFLDYMKHHYGAGFNVVPTPLGYNCFGEYYTPSGQVISITIRLTKKSQKISVYDSMRRLLYANSCPVGDSLLKDMNLLRLFQRSVVYSG